MPRYRLRPAIVVNGGALLCTPTTITTTITTATAAENESHSDSETRIANKIFEIPAKSS